MELGVANISALDCAGDVLQLVQVTDCHLCQVEGGTLLGMDTDHSLQAVMARLRKERGTPDVALLTGDLADHGSVAAYRRMAHYSSQLASHYYWLPGNHDNRYDMQAAGIAPDCLASEILLSGWQIILLDTQIDGAVGGELGADQLQLLEQALERTRATGTHTLICMHHHPVAIGCAWLDEQMVADAAGLFEIVDRFAQVKGILWGHIHQQIDRERNGIALMGSPSTCVQFAPGSHDFKADSCAPGYRWLELYPDGLLKTGVSRVDDVVFHVDLDSQGYLD